VLSKITFQFIEGKISGFDSKVVCHKKLNFSYLRIGRNDKYIFANLLLINGHVGAHVFRTGYGNRLFLYYFATWGIHHLYLLCTPSALGYVFSVIAEALLVPVMERFGLYTKHIGYATDIDRMLLYPIFLKSQPYRGLLWLHLRLLRTGCCNVHSDPNASNAAV
jgi:hypothetical protein